MRRKAPVLKASLAAAFVATGGAAAAQAHAAANPDAASVDGIVSSYYGPLGLNGEFAAWIEVDSGGLYDSFAKFYKFDVSGATEAVFVFSAYKEVPPPPGFDQPGGD
jgi:hypothetical protein